MYQKEGWKSSPLQSSTLLGEELRVTCATVSISRFVSPQRHFPSPADLAFQLLDQSDLQRRSTADPYSSQAILAAVKRLPVEEEPCPQELYESARALVTRSVN